MEISKTISVAKNQAYERPYKTRQQRRLAERRKADDSNDNAFLIKVAVVIGFILLVAVGFAMKGMADHQNASAPFPTSAE